ncbi:MAG: FitA-like ribbon-helix-helix domain-containing protein [Pyrinomonadaceae bacterium]
MATLTIKNLPDEIYAALTIKAKQNRRSINSEAIVQLEQLRNTSLGDVGAELKEIRKLREKTKGLWLTDEILETAKNEGRP